MVGSSKPSIAGPSSALNFLSLLLIFGLNILSFSHFTFVPLLVWTLYSVYFNSFPRHSIKHTCYDLKVYPKVPCDGNVVPRVTVLATGTSKRGLRLSALLLWAHPCYHECMFVTCVG